MKLQKLSLFSLFILLSFAVSSFAYSYSGSIMTDLISTDPSQFSSDVNNWSVSSQACSGCQFTSTIPPNTCGIPEVMIVGGPNTLGPSGSSTSGQYYRAYYPSTNTPSGAVALEFDVYTFYDAIPSNAAALNFFYMNIDSYYSASQTYASLENSCILDYTYSAGVTIKAFYKFHFKIFFHNYYSNHMEIQFLSQFNVPSTVSSFGLRNLQYYMDSSISISYPVVPSLFPCYRSPWDGSSCITCDGYCKTCTGSSYHQCTSCNNGYYDYQNGTCLGTCDSPFTRVTSNGYPYLCQKTCASNTFYWYYNDSCSPTCQAPLQSKVDGNNVSICSNPCYYNDANQSYLYTYMYPDGTCVTSCPSTLKTVVPYLCQTPCPNSNDFLFQNGSCTSSCISPLVSTNNYGIGYCNSPCSGQYIVLDGSSCSASCAPPLVAKDDSTDIKYCTNPCAATDTFLYANSSCYSTCPSPLQSSTASRVKYCKNPCAGTSNFLYNNGSCLSTCASPLIEKNEPGVKYCINPCSINDYLYANGSCFSDCISPLKIYTEAVAKFCINPCAGTSNFLYNNGSCLSTCASPLLEKSEPGVKYCVNPCLISDTYLYANSSCLSDCISPLKIYTEAVGKFCINPCAGTSNNFLYNNGSCFSTCASPLIEKNDPGIKFCMNPCAAAGSYLLPNGSCATTCLAPLTSYSEPGVKYCSNPCAIYDTFLYEDGVCQATCALPNIEKTESIGKFCKYPCANTALYYYTTDGKCKATCEYPYQATDSPLPKICSSSLSEEEIKQIKKLAETTDTANSASSSGILIGTILSSSDSTSVCMGPFSKMLSYVKYMDIVYPEKVQLMFQQQSESASKGGFTSKMAKGILEDFADHELPEKFETYKANSSFFVNFWPALFNLLVILAVTIGVILLRMALGTCRRVRLVVGQVEETLRWNVVLVTFCGNFGDIVLFTALEFQTMQFGNASDGVSFAVCLMMNLLCLFVVIKILDVNSAVRKSKQNLKGRRKEIKEQEIEKNWSSYKALFACYRDQSYFQQIFLFIFIVRISLFTGIIGYLYKYPLLQAVIINLVNILILLYLLLKRPIKQLVNLIQQVVLELVLLPFNMCVLILAILDFRGAEAIDQRKRIGNVMVYINVLIPILSVVLMASKFLVIGYQFYKQWKAEKLKKQQQLGNKMVQKVDFRGEHYGDSKMNGIPNRIQARMSKPQIFVENTSSNQTITNPMQTLDITQQSQSQLDLSTSQDTSFVLNNSINPFISQSRGRRPVRFENRVLLTPGPGQNNLLKPSYSYQANGGRGRKIELAQAETFSNYSSENPSYNQSPNQSPQRAGRIAKRKNKINRERGSPSRSIGGFSEN